MKIVHIITGLKNGGAEGVLYRLVSHDKLNDHIVISLTGEGKYGSLLRNRGIEVFCLEISKDKISIKPLIKLYKILKKANPEIVQTWMYHADLIGGLVARSLGIKKIFWNIRHSNFDPRYTKPSTIKVAKICSKLSYFIPYKIISCSDLSLNPHIDLGYTNDRFIVINNGYDLENFKININSRNNIRKSLKIGNLPVLGMVGRYNPQKNHKGLLEALSRVSKQGYQFDLLLVGEGLNQGNNEILEAIKLHELEYNVHLLDQRNDIPDIMNALDIHILSSSFGEGFPNVVAEAMACGTPCIVTNVGESKTIVAKFGKVIEPDNIDELTKAIIQFIDLLKSNQEDWQYKRLNGSEFITESFSIDKMINSYNEAWKNS